jgi:hypothetical protein
VRSGLALRSDRTSDERTLSFTETYRYTSGAIDAEKGQTLNSVN